MFKIIITDSVYQDIIRTERNVISDFVNGEGRNGI